MHKDYLSCGAKINRYYPAKIQITVRKKVFRRFKRLGVYILICVSLTITLVNGAFMVTPWHLRALFPRILLLNDGTFDATRFSLYLLFTISFWLAVVTIRRKNLVKARLLEKLRAANWRLEYQVQKRTSELAEALMAKDHFLAIATHDLKAPLNGILGLTNLLRTEKNIISQAQTDYLNHIEYSCNKMKRLIEDILEINRIEQGKTVMKTEVVDLQALMDKLELNFSQEAERKEIRLIIARVPGAINTDAMVLMRILENLVSNAIKFSPFGRSIWLRINISDQVSFEVEDQGPGIPSHEQPKLFEKFQRLTNRPTNAEASTGLGLSIVKELTNQLGGEITFRSVVGKGTVFVVKLPLQVSHLAAERRTESLFSTVARVDAA